MEAALKVHRRQRLHCGRLRVLRDGDELRVRGGVVVLQGETRVSSPWVTDRRQDISTEMHVAITVCASSGIKGSVRVNTESLGAHRPVSHKDLVKPESELTYMKRTSTISQGQGERQP